MIDEVGKITNKVVVDQRLWVHLILLQMYSAILTYWNPTFGTQQTLCFALQAFTVMIFWAAEQRLAS
jgi:hypothetical protein